ncbi:MAG TPA: lytic transglycosylase domain-containing protein, partial [Bacteroidales bacterium]|nr:lytic transglycosylase domain-containing protein [Bacteroidales bacterium]
IVDPSAYGFDIEEDELYPELKYHEVEVKGEIADFSDFAASYGTNYKLLKFLNPWLRQPYLNPRQGKTYLIKIPAEGMRNPESIESFSRIYYDSQ